jgi:macrodomain Ter protein organizer (MatP/YcbG family)
MTPYYSTAGCDQALQKHCIHMEQEVWDQAAQTARSLGLSTSQFLSRLIIETSPLIQPNSLLGLRRNVSATPRSYSEH